jgi:Zn-dependent metalloprotease
MSIACRFASSSLLLGLTTIAGCGMTEQPDDTKTGTTVVEPVRFVDVGKAPIVDDVGRTAVDVVRSVGMMAHSDRDGWAVRSSLRGADGLEHVRLDQTYASIKVWNADVVVHADEANVRAVNGSIAREIDPYLDINPTLRAADALQIAKSEYARGASTLAPLEYKREQTELVIVPGADGTARLAWHTVFFTELQAGKEPGLWNNLIAADTGEILESWNGIHTLSQASGPGGNAKVTRTWTDALDVEPSGSQYVMNTARLATYNLNGGTSGGSLVTGPLNPIGDAPINDAHGFAEITLNMLSEWYGHNSINDSGFKIVSRVHYGNRYENAFWDGAQMTYGDGATTFYPLSGDVDVVSHEINHGFTTFHSNLTYSGQSGGNNESFSDIAGTIAEFFSEGAGADWDLGTDIFRGNTALRFMCNPTQDGSSIDNAANFRNGMDVHYSSGVMNKAFCRAARRISSGSPDGAATQAGVRRAGEAWYAANSSYWNASSNFVQACQGVIDAARALGFSDTEIGYISASCSDVGVACDGAPPPPPTCDETLTAANGTLTSPNYPNQYPNNYTRTWCIRPGASTTLTFSAFNTESGYDFVSITDGNTGRVLANTSGATAPAAQSGDFLVVKFTTDSSVTSTGWSASWGGGGPANQAPTVAITAPASGSTVGNTVTATATAADSDGTVARVVFTFPNGASVTDTSAPYSATWDSTTVTNGAYQIRAQAFDNRDLGSTVASVNVTVANGTGSCIDGTFASADVPKAIPDNNSTGVTSVLPITGNGVVSTLQLSLNITHTYRSDLRVTLLGPDGTQYVAHNRTGGSADNLVITNRGVTNFNNRTAAGTWSLRVQDLAGQDVGNLTSWSLRIVGRCN